ncbi:DUF4920 domain-containing protein [Idiomarina aminovorans]|uniref:DUF4920 domain-containing protein n=1 Tax=Idiomarina aminovorans TaxID=2914829 RepID=UPI00200350B7|nr:DUF4920 domain-containing protein [Idiomarina sp. ATCH4]MCK7460101.1 DUF4920 domain-containing protein [Idiomarina sp. ATCH4]
MTQKLTVILFIALTLLSLFLTARSAVAAQMVFGSGAKQQNVIDVTTLMENPQQYLSQKITIRGKIEKVCKKRGCWMELVTEPTSTPLTIKVKDGEMVFPMSKLGHVALATGTLSIVKLDIGQSRDYLAHRAEEQEHDFNPEAVTEALQLYRFSPEGVTILD